MRSAYQRELEGLGTGLVDMARLAADAVERATTALLDADLALAENVIAADRRIDDLQHSLEGGAVGLLARQQPVASDLRAVVTALRVTAGLERAGDLAGHVAELAHRRFPDHVVPAELHGTIL